MVSLGLPREKGRNREIPRGEGKWVIGGRSSEGEKLTGSGGERIGSGRRHARARVGRAEKENLKEREKIGFSFICL